jgi:hypothetical protein
LCKLGKKTISDLEVKIFNNTSEMINYMYMYSQENQAPENPPWFGIERMPTKCKRDDYLAKSQHCGNSIWCSGVTTSHNFPFMSLQCRIRHLQKHITYKLLPSLLE